MSDIIRSGEGNQNGSGEQPRSSGLTSQQRFRHYTRYWGQPSDAAEQHLTARLEQHIHDTSIELGEVLDQEVPLLERGRYTLAAINRNTFQARFTQTADTRPSNPTEVGTPQEGVSTGRITSQQPLTEAQQLYASALPLPEQTRDIPSTRRQPFRNEADAENRFLESGDIAHLASRRDRFNTIIRTIQHPEFLSSIGDEHLIRQFQQAFSDFNQVSTARRDNNTLENRQRFLDILKDLEDIIETIYNYQLPTYPSTDTRA